jgi:hypothetical protein
VHLAAFRCVVKALGGNEMILFPDNCWLDDLLYAGRSLWDCIEFMEGTWGPPQPSVEEIDPKVGAGAEHTVPQVWYLESSITEAQLRSLPGPLE